MHQVGQTLDMANLDQIACDTFNIPQKSLMRPMTPQEQQQLQQQQQMEIMSKMELQNSRLQAQSENQDAKDETALIKEMFLKLLTPDAVHALFGQMFGMQHPEETKAKFAPKKLANGKA
jgi:predicted Mrr-cat superfamily restriction endonuclease